MHLCSKSTYVQIHIFSLKKRMLSCSIQIIFCAKRMEQTFVLKKYIISILHQYSLYVLSFFFLNLQKTNHLFRAWSGGFRHSCFRKQTFVTNTADNFLFFTNQHL